MRFLVYAILSCLVLDAYAQSHHFVSYSVKEGLAQSQVRDIIQSDDGYLWIATIGGVSRFDGKNFKNYNNSNGLLNNIVTSIYETSDGMILIACQGGLVRLNMDRIETFPFPETFEQTIVLDITEHRGDIYLATNGSGILKWNTGEIDQTKFEDEAANFIRSIGVYNNNIILGSRAGLGILKGSEVSYIIPDISVNKTSCEGDELWVTTTTNGVFQITDKDTFNFTIENGLNSMFQRDVCLDRNGDPWFISKNGITRYDRTTKTISAIRPTILAHSENLKVLYRDEDSNIWVGTSGSGLLKFTGEFAHTYTLRDGLQSDQIMSIRQDRNGALWFATYGSGITKLQDGIYSHLGFEDGLRNNTVWSLEFHKDSLWIGTSDGINILHEGKLQDFPFNDSLPFTRVSSIFSDSKDGIWIGTRDGLIRYKRGQLITPRDVINLGLSEVKSFCEVEGTVWISSRHGIHSYDLTSGEVIRRSVGHELDVQYISSMTKDLRNNVWIGTEDGIYKYSNEGQSFERYSVSDKPSANIINFLTHDSLNSLWIGTDNGLFSLNTELVNSSSTVHFRSYNEHDGIISQECNQNAAYCDRTGMLWFGLNAALVSINPDKIDPSRMDRYGAVLGDLQVNFRSIPLDSLHQTSVPTFTYRQNRLTFKYSAIQFANPEKVFYSYRLLGSEENWSPMIKENSVTYANLAPGEYEFQTRIRLENTEWGEASSLLQFKISPPFYFTWWFICILILIALALGYGVYVLVHSARERKRRFEDVQNKAKILGLEQQTLNAHMNRHFIFNALNSIQYYINTQEKKLANMYLTKFASLVRKNLDSAQSDYITLFDEVERLKLYMNLEQMRFKDRFNFNFEIAPELNTEHIYVPSMILQPFVENSIMHGILPAERHGELNISVLPIANDLLRFTITDNGIGIETSVKQKNGTSYHVSNGMKITRQRMEVLQKMTGKKHSVEGPSELRSTLGDVKGTQVQIFIPKQIRA